MKQVGSHTWLVFLCYFNSYWPPLRKTFGPEHDNVVFMFAPISRCYAHALAGPACAADRPLRRPPAIASPSPAPLANCSPAAQCEHAASAATPSSTTTTCGPTPKATAAPSPSPLLPSKTPATANPST